MKKIFNKRNLISFILITLSSLLMVYTFQTFVFPANLVSGGFTGLAILVNKFLPNLSISVLIIILNLPVAIMCIKGISLRFTLFSVYQFALVSFLFTVCNFEPVFDDIILEIVFGGFLNGLCVVLALKADASSGGTDFIALYFSNKFNRSLWNEVFFFNATIIIIFGFQEGWTAAGYSILFQFISTLAINRFYQRYRRITIQIMTNEAKPIIDMYVKKFRHGITVSEGYGGYSKLPITTITTVVSSYEVKEIEKNILEIDPACIINEFTSNKFIGKFYMPPMN